MKRLFATLFSVTLLLTGCSSSGSATNLNATEFIPAGHVQGAVNIDVSAPTFAGEIASLDKETVYAIYCRSGNRSTIAAGKMSDAGFTNLFNFNKGGFAELAAAGAPTA